MSGFRALVAAQWPLVKNWWTYHREHPEIPGDIRELGDRFVARVTDFLKTGV